MACTESWPEQKKLRRRALIFRTLFQPLSQKSMGEIIFNTELKNSEIDLKITFGHELSVRNKIRVHTFCTHTKVVHSRSF